MKLNELIKEIKEINDNRALSDEYLAKHGYSTRKEVGIGEYSYGIVMCPVDLVLPYLEELVELRSSKSWDEYFKGLDTKQIAELAKKSIRLTTENRKLENKLSDIAGICEQILDGEDYVRRIAKTILDIID